MLLTNEEAVRDVSAAFLEYDGGAKGYLTRHELRAAHLALFGFQPSTIEMDVLLPKLRDGGPMGLDLPGFCSAMVPRLCTQDADELSRRTFRAFDTERRGYISFADFSRAMRHVAPHLPHETIDLVFSQVDSDGDGRVRWRRTSRPAHTRAPSHVRAYRLFPRPQLPRLPLDDVREAGAGERGRARVGPRVQPARAPPEERSPGRARRILT